MARKGVVINDPSVRTMNEAQWVFEYLSLVEYDKQKAEIAGDLFKAIRKMVVSTLGLDAVGKIAGLPDDHDFIVPLALMTATPEILAKLIEVAEEEAEAQNALEDDSFEALSQHLMETTAPKTFEDGDMQPIPFAEPLDLDPNIRANAYMHTDEYQQMLKSLVHPRTSPEDHEQPPKPRVTFTN